MCFHSGVKRSEDNDGKCSKKNILKEFHILPLARVLTGYNNTNN